MTRLIRHHWRVMLLLLCSLMMISNNTAMAWQMAASSHEAHLVTTSVAASSQHGHHTSKHTPDMGKQTSPDTVLSVDHTSKTQHKSCVAQSCCFCLNYQPELHGQFSISIKPIELLAAPIHQQPLAGHFNNLYRPPCLNT